MLYDFFALYVYWLQYSGMLHDNAIVFALWNLVIYIFLYNNLAL